MTTEWNARVYHQVSDPQFAWGLPVLARLRLRGDETVLDAGCGTGRLTAELLGRLPRGRVVALDRSRQMLASARAHLAHFGGQVAFVHADLARQPLRPARVDVVFSTATFHWVLDHPTLFAQLHAALRPGGTLVAQCGGAGNLAAVHGRVLALTRETAYREWFRDWTSPWEFATPETTTARLAAAGFAGIRTSLEDAPVTLPDREAFVTFVTVVVLRPYLARLPDERTRARFVSDLADQSALDPVPFTLDYVRLNLDARRPPE